MVMWRIQRLDLEPSASDPMGTYIKALLEDIDNPGTFAVDARAFTTADYVADPTILTDRLTLDGYTPNDWDA